MNIRRFFVFFAVLVAGLALAGCGANLSALQSKVTNYNSSNVLTVPPKKLRGQLQGQKDVSGKLAKIDLKLSKSASGSISNDKIVQNQKRLNKVRSIERAVDGQITIIKKGLFEQPIKMFKFGMAAARMYYLPCHMTLPVVADVDPKTLITIKRARRENNAHCNWKDQGQIFYQIGQKLIAMGDLKLAASVDFSVNPNTGPYETKLAVKKVGKDFATLTIRHWGSDAYWPWNSGHPRPGYVL